MPQNAIQSLYRVNEVEIVYRNKVPYQDRIQITQSSTAYKILRQCWDENRIELVEQFKILLLDRRHTCLGISEIATGGINGCVVDPRIVFATALKTKASALILAHNHPSGAPRKRIGVMYKTENQSVPVFGVDTAVRGAGSPIKTYDCLKPP